MQTAHSTWDHTSERKEEGKKGKEREWVAKGTTAYPHRVVGSDPSQAPDRHHHRHVDSGSIRALHADYGDGGWCGFTGASNTSNVRNLDVDKVGAVMIMVIVVVERIKRSRRKDVCR